MVPITSSSSASSTVSSVELHQEPKYNCQRCQNHGKYHPRKNHKPFCRYRDCKCKKCHLVEKRRVSNKALNQKGQKSKKESNGPKKRDNMKCAKCNAHGQDSAVKGHKKQCPFINCHCEKCVWVVERRGVMACQIRFRRQQRKKRHGTNDGAASEQTAKRTIQKNSTDNEPEQQKRKQPKKYTMPPSSTAKKNPALQQLSSSAAAVPHFSAPSPSSMPFSTFALASDNSAPLPSPINQTSGTDKQLTYLPLAMVLQQIQQKQLKPPAYGLLPAQMPLQNSSFGLPCQTNPAPLFAPPTPLAQAALLANLPIQPVQNASFPVPMPTYPQTSVPPTSILALALASLLGGTMQQPAVVGGEHGKSTTTFLPKPIPINPMDNNHRLLLQALAQQHSEQQRQQQMPKLTQFNSNDDGASDGFSSLFSIRSILLNNASFCP